MARKSLPDLAPDPIPLPSLRGRVAVLGGSDQEKTAWLIGLALRQVRQQGSVLCVDARCYRATEVQFRLLLRKSNTYVRLPSSGEVSPAVAQTVLSTIG
ncbi:MAG: hypothetical protein NZ578_00880, partial [Candidatus Binatia bacterium]|nr:hypothetical protein [Candidatus Binatia bacterium]